MFRGLAEALYVLATGQAIGNRDPPKSKTNANLKEPGNLTWQELVHTDITTQNVAIGEPTTSFPAFKTPMLIDFGLAKSSGRTSLIQGTIGWQPPV